MPTLIFNELTVTGPKKEIERFLKAAGGHHPLNRRNKMPLSLHSLYPIPLPLETKNPADWDDLEHWYHWCWDHWGTPWDILEHCICERRSANEVYFSFGTAYVSPEPAFTDKIAPDFPKLNFCLREKQPTLIVIQKGCSHQHQWQGGHLVANKKTTALKGLEDEEIMQIARKEDLRPE